MSRLTGAVVVLHTGGRPRCSPPKGPADEALATCRPVAISPHERVGTRVQYEREFRADGTAIRLPDRARNDEYRFRYTIDASASPARMDHLYDEPGKPPALCIFKLEGDTLTTCYSTRKVRMRPKEFGEAKTMVQVLKRIKSKD